jgi:hypothetical protein
MDHFARMLARVTQRHLQELLPPVHTAKCRGQRRSAKLDRFRQTVDPLYCSNQETN